MILWAVFSFISNSVLALHHLFLLVPILILNKKLFQEIPKSILILLAFCLVAVISVFVNYSELEKPMRNISRIKYEVFASFAAMLFFYFRKDLKKYSALIFSLFLLSFSFANLYGICKWLYQKYYLDIFPDRLSGFFGMSMSYAYTAVFPILLLVGLLVFSDLRRSFEKDIQEKKYLRRFYEKKNLIFLLVLSFISLLMCQTRGEMVGVLVGVPVLFYFKNKKVFYSLSLTSTFFVVLALVYTYNFGSPENRIFKSLNSVNHSERFSQAKVGVHLFLEKPLLGAGFRSFEERDPRVKIKYDIPDKDFIGHAHNNFIEVLATTGLMGFLFFILWVFFWFKEIMIISDIGIKSFFIASVVSFLVTGLFQSTLIDAEYCCTLFALYALTFGCSSVIEDQGLKI